MAKLHFGELLTSPYFYQTKSTRNKQADFQVMAINSIPNTEVPLFVEGDGFIPQNHTLGDTHPNPVLMLRFFPAIPTEPYQQSLPIDGSNQQPLFALRLEEDIEHQRIKAEYVKQGDEPERPLYSRSVDDESLDTHNPFQREIIMDGLEIFKAIPREGYTESDRHFGTDYRDHQDGFRVQDLVSTGSSTNVNRLATSRIASYPYRPG